MKKTEPSRSQPHVLVVDDDAIMRGVAHESLTEAGFWVSEAENGLQALAALDDLQPDIILLDVMMPEMDGFETAIAVRQMLGGELIPILIMTALDDLDSIHRAYEVGATDFITKPINWVILVQRVRYMLRAVQTMNEQQRLQEELQQAQKLEAVATLAGGVAHDFNNLLQTIQGSAELIMLKREKETPGQKELEQIIAAVGRGAALTRQILTYSREIESEKRPIDLNAQLRQTHQLLQRTIPKMIEIELDLETDLHMIDADAVQMEQVLMNLAINGRDAMPDGGKLSIRTINAAAPATHGDSKSGPATHDWVLLQVADSGHGMDKQTVDQIFEPFFSTKAPGKGTGLGLSMVHGIVQNHDGHITCRSTPGKGTCFDIYLPAIAPVDTLAPTSPKQISRQGTETILLVDDDESIRGCCQTWLENAGYTVLAVADAEAALAVYGENGPGIQLVLLDLIMPGMGGEKGLHALVHADPDIKVVIISGHAPDERAQQLIDRWANGYLRKPYTGEQLLETIGRVLDGA